MGVLEGGEAQASSPHTLSNQNDSGGKDGKSSYSRRKRASGHIASVICQFVDTSGRGIVEAKKKEKNASATSNDGTEGAEAPDTAPAAAVATSAAAPIPPQQQMPLDAPLGAVPPPPTNESFPMATGCVETPVIPPPVSSPPRPPPPIPPPAQTTIVTRQPIVAPTTLAAALAPTRQSVLPPNSNIPPPTTTLRQYVQSAAAHLSGNQLRQTVPNTNVAASSRQQALFPVAIAASVRDTRQPVLAQLNMETKRHYGVPPGLVSSLEAQAASANAEVTNNMATVMPQQVAALQENRVLLQQQQMAPYQGVEQQQQCIQTPVGPPPIVDAQLPAQHAQVQRIPIPVTQQLAVQQQQLQQMQQQPQQRVNINQLLEGGVRGARNSRYAAALAAAIARQNQPLPWNAPPIARRTPPTSDEEEASKNNNGNKVIRLRMKRQRRRMVGIYRAIPEIDSMCRAVEDADYDKTDLFPLGEGRLLDALYGNVGEVMRILGLEPSDDEDSTYPSSSVLPTASLAVSSYSGDLSTQLYLIKKQLRLERHALLKQAQLNAHIMCASRRLPLSVGAALRQRSDPSPPPLQLAPASLRRCCQLDNTNKQRFVPTHSFVD
ncbi:hypothetical protein ANCDUO_00314 [Ancylostoma duodenale]|uniref:Uncharacterized protein n=1 Tax=Ancylostoma duodenale TaxID=51022 RepID=A0A0C2HIA7_9BILA|nr:hypothetical protein ANCDUO_00314 [Ancylostoma duodenale]